MAKRRQKELVWGETPFDRMSPEEVLLNAKRMYSALISLESLAKQMRLGNEQSPYWSVGVGGAAIEKGAQALAGVDADYTSEDVYRSFYRYADDLLFDTGKHPMIGSGWWVCDADGTMLGGHPDGSHTVMCFKCNGPLRPITWADMAPQPTD